MTGNVSHPQHAAIRPEWLALHAEGILDPEQPIVDAHHHLYDRPGMRYLFDEALSDLASGHDVRATVFVQARAMHRAGGPEELRPIGETEFANGVAAMAASGNYGRTRLCSAIVSTADLLLGDGVKPVLEAHIRASPERFRGIRHTAAWDPDPSLLNPAYKVSEDLLATGQFRAGFAHLARLDLSFDAWLFFHQMPRLTELAKAFPDTRIVVNHCGGILGIGPYAGRREDVYASWHTGIKALAQCANVMIKLGGLGMRMGGFGFDALPKPAPSTSLAEAWRPWVETAIDVFGTDRCMLENNFPVDKGSFTYAVGWNAMKRLSAAASEDEKTDLFWRSAARFYRLSPDDLGGLTA
ncbi:MAG: amidohydrolase [Hyphomicrobiaceae bacterium]